MINSLNDEFLRKIMGKIAAGINIWKDFIEENLRGISDKNENDIIRLEIKKFRGTIYY